jgi:hypothetical protein
MSPESSDPMQLEDAKWPGDDGWPDDAEDEQDPDWPDDAEDELDPDWPDDWPDDGRDDPPWRRAAPPTAYRRGGGLERRGLRPFALAAVAVVALAVGAGVALVMTRGIDNLASHSAGPSSQPSFAPSGGNSGGTVPGGSGNGAVPGGSGATGQAFVAGPVQKVSSTSITIGGPGQSMTAAVTSATKVTGKVTSIGAIKVGDDVSAQIAISSSGQATVTAIQDPAQEPSSGGGLP